MCFHCRQRASSESSCKLTKVCKRDRGATPGPVPASPVMCRTGQKLFQVPPVLVEHIVISCLTLRCHAVPVVLSGSYTCVRCRYVGTCRIQVVLDSRWLEVPDLMGTRWGTKRNKHLRCDPCTIHCSVTLLLSSPNSTTHSYRLKLPIGFRSLSAPDNSPPAAGPTPSHRRTHRCQLPTMATAVPAIACLGVIGRNVGVPCRGGGPLDGPAQRARH